MDTEALLKIMQNLGQKDIEDLTKYFQEGKNPPVQNENGKSLQGQLNDDNQGPQAQSQAAKATLDGEWFEYLKAIYNKRHPNQVIHELLSKLKMEDASYTFIENVRGFRWGCTGDIKELNLRGDGFNINKKEAKSILIKLTF
jgi:hypothetical protein